MNILLRPAIPSDASVLAEINILAFANQGFISNAFPNVPYNAVHPLKCTRYLQKMAHPQTQVIAAIDQDSGEVLGCARWVFPSDKPGESAAELMSDAAAKEKEAVDENGAGAQRIGEPNSSSSPGLPEGTNKEIYDGFFQILKESARGHLRDDDIVLEFIATHPKYQGRGVGKALLAWGIERAGKEGKRIYLEATEEGYPVYVKNGWRALARVEIDYARWGGVGGQALTLMVRNPDIPLSRVNMEIQILPLTKPDIPDAVECIQTVFADDPFFQYMFDPDTYNIRRNAASLRAHFLHGLALNAPIYVAKQIAPNNYGQKVRPDKKSNPVVGICWWIPPTPTHTRVPFSHRTQDALLSLRQFLANIQFFGRGGLRLKRYKQWKSLQRQKHDSIWTDERGYYFCNVIAVRDEMRGRGLGRRLVEAVTDQADEEGMACYLESSKGMPNLRIYEKLGFQGKGEIECFDSEKRGKEGVTLYCMIRPPTTDKQDDSC
ncbi:acyl-CoA N-acyltransferase [Aspergillus filifer]